MIVRSYLPWPVRWVVIALMLGFSAALALWAFEFGREISGLDRNVQAELARLKVQIQALQGERDQALLAANTAESRWKTDQASFENLVVQLKASQAEVMSLKADLGFFERLMPTHVDERGVAVRGVRLERQSAEQLRFQVLLMQPGRGRSDFEGRYDITLLGLMDGQPWRLDPAEPTGRFALKRYLRLEGVISVPPTAVVKTAIVNVTDKQGVVKATHSVKL